MMSMPPEWLHVVRPLLQACSRQLQRVVTVVKAAAGGDWWTSAATWRASASIACDCACCYSTSQSFARENVTGSSAGGLWPGIQVRNCSICMRSWYCANMIHAVSPGWPVSGIDCHMPFQILSISALKLGGTQDGSLDMWCSLGMFLLWPGDTVGSGDARQLPRSTPGAMNVAQNNTICMRKHYGLNSWQVM